MADLPASRAEHNPLSEHPDFDAPRSPCSVFKARRPHRNTRAVHIPRSMPASHIAAFAQPMSCVQCLWAISQHPFNARRPNRNISHSHILHPMPSGHIAITNNYIPCPMSGGHIAMPCSQIAVSVYSNTNRNVKSTRYRIADFSLHFTLIVASSYARNLEDIEVLKSRSAKRPSLIPS